MNNRRVDASRPLASLLEAARAVEEQLERQLAAEGLSASKLKVLTRLVEAGESVALSALAEMCACVRSNVTQLVDRLEADGLVRRVSDPSDRRSIRAELTAKGRERQSKGAAILATVEHELAAQLPAEVTRALAAITITAR